jgi:tRNA(Arg) A34 adenosine deaminase TadA
MEPSRREETMRRAIELARSGMERDRGGPFGALVVKDGRVVGEGCNEVTSTCDPTAHAEIVAIRDACRRLATFDLSGCEIFASCEPCPMCLAAILWARIGRVTWAGTREDAAEAGFDDARFYEEIARAPEQRTLPSGTLLRDEARALFRAWLAKPDRIAY